MADVRLLQNKYKVNINILVEVMMMYGLENCEVS